ncbi:MAG: DEAD/DEAH box helicase family protein [Gammaproteobacteria bacterium]|nr:DEAD/DEAH box helicase family protein [Gammaproteobacteria bacterium]
MPRKRQPKLTTTQRRLRLERQLSLVHWLSHEFGFKDNADMLKHCKESEGMRGGKSLVYHALQSREHRIPAAKLDAYENNIQRHLDSINRRRQAPIALKYFQQLAALGVEHYLDRLAASPNQLLAQLNGFVRRENAGRLDKFAEYAADDLKKIAFWMATGSGKTLLLHLNYLQFLHYFPDDADNILLVTPNESLSEQHLQEFAMSGIAARRVEESADVLSSANPVQVVEITKLVEKKRGKKGAGIPLERFEGKNLLFVDEGHKGAGGEAWFKARDQLGAHGFTFEYSATFGQALFARGGDKLTEQYGKNILFDYSYRYFHDDGFGKDFNVLNLAQDPAGNRMDLLMTGNLLSFYQQIIYFEEQRDQLRPYRLEKPLLLMLGSTVTKGTETTASDVAELVGFVHRFAQNKQGQSVKQVRAVLGGQSGLVNDAGEDVFSGKFSYIAGRDAETVYRDMLKRVFHAETGGALFLCPLKRAAGEIGMKIGADNPRYFALAFVGNVKKLCDLIVKKCGVAETMDAISDSLFAGVNAPGSAVNMLIGAKKFMEGWNSWRVAGMGLLNVGKSEGAEIIQLFGRGVRLRGRGMSLKRSAALGGMAHPDHLHLLETLNIFAVRADFIASFRLYLEREGVDNYEISLGIDIKREFLKQKLLIPKINGEFTDAVALAPDKVRVTVDFSERVQSMQSGGGQVVVAQQSQNEERKWSEHELEYLDWEDLYLRLLEHKRARGWDNLLVRQGDLRGILEQGVKIKAPVERGAANFSGNMKQLGDIALAGLQKYADRLHHTRQIRWQTEHMTAEELDEAHGNFKDYIVQIPRDQKELIERIKQAVQQANWEHEQQAGDLPNVHFDRHLFQPLLCGSGENVTLIPAGLVESEKKFVASLRDYCESHREQIKELEIFLLRNLPHRGVGFPDESGDNFYPDFILWVKRGKDQRVVFVEPHGLLQDPVPAENSKVKLHKWLEEISKRWGGRYAQQMEIDSFIVSDTHPDELRRRWGAENDPDNHQILFLDEDQDLVPALLKWKSPAKKSRGKPRR